jgi:hypothetical protein
VVEHKKDDNFVMTNMKPASSAAAKVPSVVAAAVARVPGPSQDVDELGETYMVHEESEKDVSNDLDDFEARLNGHKPSDRKPMASKRNDKAVPKSNVPPMFMPPKHKPVKATSLSEEQEDALEALKAVSELDKFDMRLKPK